MVIAYEPRAVKVLRTRKGFRIDELAHRARVSQRQIRYLERGAIPKADTLAKLASALGVSVRAFYSETRRAS